jgi:putative transcriptional regulator
MKQKLRINRLKGVLADKGIAHKEFAKMVKKTPNTITRICNNEQQPSLVLLREMAIALDVEMGDLLVRIKA